MLTGRRATVTLLTLSILALAASSVLTATTASRAAATCNGPGQPVVISRYDTNGTLVASEGPPYPGSTCNNDAAYSGLVLDAYTDGSCAYAYYFEPVTYYAQQGVSCTTGAWSGYSYTDSTGPNSVYVSTRPSYLSDQWRLSTGY